MIIFVDGKGFFESMGSMGITFTKDINKAFQFTDRKSIYSVRSTLINSNFLDITVLKVIA